MTFVELMRYMWLPAIMIAAVMIGVGVSYGVFRHNQTKRKKEIQQRKARARTGASIVGSVRTNNSVPYLEKTFEDLAKNLKANEIELNVNLRGYTSDAE